MVVHAKDFCILWSIRGKQLIDYTFNELSTTKSIYFSKFLSVRRVSSAVITSLSSRMQFLS